MFLSNKVVFSMTLRLCGEKGLDVLNNKMIFSVHRCPCASVVNSI